MPVLLTAFGVCFAGAAARSYATLQPPVDAAPRPAAPATLAGAAAPVGGDAAPATPVSAAAPASAATLASAAAPGSVAAPVSAEAPVALAVAAEAPASAAPVSVAAPAVEPAAPATCSFVMRYARGATAPLAADASQLDRLGRWLADAPAAEVVVRAHADGTGSTRHNFDLSEKRGGWIVQRLRRAGVAEDRMTAQAFGEYVPLEGLGRDDDRNRRTVVHLRGLATCPSLEDAR